VKYVNKCELLKNAIRFFFYIFSTFPASSGFSRFLFSDFGNHFTYRGNRTSLVNCCHRNVCSVLCVGVGMHLTNRYLVIGDFTEGTIFIQPLAGNGGLRRFLYSGFVGRIADKFSA
jgi:hypothetical protein